MSDHDLTVRIDVLDLIITVLKEYEKTLSEILSRLEDAVDELREIKELTRP